MKCGFCWVNVGEFRLWMQWKVRLGEWVSGWSWTFFLCLVTLRPWCDESERPSFSSDKMFLNFRSLSCTIHALGSALCCSAGGWEEEEDADEIWIISSQCLAKPHFAGTAAFQCSSPPTQPASCRPSIWLTPHPAQPLINQTHTYINTSLSITAPWWYHPSSSSSPVSSAAFCTKGNADFWRFVYPVNRILTKNSR